MARSPATEGHLRRKLAFLNQMLGYDEDAGLYLDRDDANDLRPYRIHAAITTAINDAASAIAHQSNSLTARELDAWLDGAITLYDIRQGEW